MWKSDTAEIISLGEGNTPLVRSKRIAGTLGLSNLYFKLENLNPTGSYKDRFASAFVSSLLHEKQTVCLATSSGNTGAALAAYCAAANIKCILAIVDGAPKAKITQMQLYGAHTYMIKGFGKDPLITTAVFELLKELAESLKVPLPISAYRYCATGMEGVQTIAYEIMDQSRGQTDHIFSPAGGGGLTLAVAQGIQVYAAKHALSDLPKVHCVQPEGNDTIASALRNGALTANAIDLATTSVSGLQVPSVLDGDAVIRECRALHGTGYVVTDDEIYEWHKRLAQEEGIFCEPAGAVALAGLASAIKKNEIKAADRVVCLVTGSGFKDMLSVDKHFDLPDIDTVDGQSLVKIIKELSS